MDYDNIAIDQTVDSVYINLCIYLCEVYRSWKLPLV